jgi:hypothetical protein
MDAQDQIRNLHLVSYWEMAVANISLWDVDASLRCWRTLEAEGTVRLPASFSPPASVS